MSSINRNEPCPCGSGQKYKKCCLAKGGHQGKTKPHPIFDPIKDYLSKQDRALTLSTIAGLMLLPENHGKNLRLESLAWYAGKYCNNDIADFDARSFQIFVSKHFAREIMEDPVESVFTANVSFVEGNRVVFPGIESYSYDVLERLLFVLIQPNSPLPEEYINLVRGVVSILLRVSDAIAHEAGYHRYMPGAGEHHGPIKFTNQLNKVRICCFIHNSWLEEQSQGFGIAATDFLELVSTAADYVRPFNVADDDNPLLKKPLVPVTDGYILAVPTSLPAALVNYVFKQAERFNVYDDLLEAYHHYNIRSINQQLYKIGWSPAEQILPDQEWGTYESFFRIDTDIFGHLIYLPDRIEIDAAVIESRMQSVTQLVESNQCSTVQILQIMVMGVSGDQILVMLERTPQSVKRIKFSSFDLYLLLNDQAVDQLTLWKFAKALDAASASIDIISIDSLDQFSFYLDNDESFFPSDESYSVVSIYSGYACEYRIKAIQSLDKHSATQYFDGNLGYVQIEKNVPYAPIFNLTHLSPESRLLLDYYQSPIWIKNAQANRADTRQTIDQFAVAILYWLFHVHNLAPLIDVHDGYPLEIELVFDQKILDNIVSTAEMKSIDLSAVPVEFGINDSLGFSLHIPWQLIGLLLANGNRAEQLIVKQVIRGLNQLYEQKRGQEFFEESTIDQTIVQAMGNPRRRMILTLPLHKDARCDPRWLTVDVRDISEADTSHLLQTLTSYLNPNIKIPSIIKNANDKNILCNQIVGALVERISILLDQYNTAELSHHLMHKNEAIIFKREYDGIRIPAQIECFSDYPTEVDKLKRSGNNLVRASLSIRCLIEFAAAKSAKGAKPVSEDGVDELLAIMEQIIQWGFTSDAINLNIDDPEMGLLPSGRIGLDKSFYKDHLNDFIHAYTEEKLTGSMEAFAHQQEPETNASRPSRTTDESVMTELDQAFNAQFGIPLKQFIRLHFILTDIAISREVSVLRIEEEELFHIIHKIDPAFSRHSFDRAIHIMALKARVSLVTPPSGYKGPDIYPWRYNRELSHLRRPLYKWKEGGKFYYQYGFRHVTVALHNLLYLLHNGRFSDIKYSHMKTVSSRINHIKGKEYRQQVYDWLHQHSRLKVIPHEVKIPDRDQDYGDVDILAWDEVNHIVYSLECKNTVPARNVYDMRGELDNYFGRNMTGGMIIKHVNRHQWLEQHSDRVCIWLGIPDNIRFTIESVVITSVELPAGYILKQKPPLPIMSFTALKKRLG